MSPQSQDVVHGTRGEMGLVSHARANSLLNAATHKCLGKGGSQQVLRRPRDIRRGGCERLGAVGVQKWGGDKKSGVTMWQISGGGSATIFLTPKYPLS